jgi:hypothetical protein
MRKQPTLAARAAFLLTGMLIGAGTLQAAKYTVHAAAGSEGPTSAYARQLLSGMEEMRLRYQALISRGGLGGQDEVAVLNPEVARHIEEMLERSPTFRAQWAEVESAGFLVRIGTHQDLGLRRDDDVGGAVHYVESRRPGYVDGALVAINLPFFDKHYREVHLAVKDGEIKATIAHEFAHVYEVALNRGHLLYLCDDPRGAVEDALESCVMQRENLFRSELGLPAAEAYGVMLPSVAEARYIVHHALQKAKARAGETVGASTGEPARKGDVAVRSGRAGAGSRR